MFEFKVYTLKEFLNEIGFDIVISQDADEKAIYDDIMDAVALTDCKINNDFCVLDISGITELANYAVWRKFDFKPNKPFETVIWWCETEEGVQEVINYAKIMLTLN